MSSLDPLPSPPLRRTNLAPVSLAVRRQMTWCGGCDGVASPSDRLGAPGRAGARTPLRQPGRAPHAAVGPRAERVVVSQKRGVAARALVSRTWPLRGGCAPHLVPVPVVHKSEGKTQEAPALRRESAVQTQRPRGACTTASPSTTGGLSRRLPGARRTGRVARAVRAAAGGRGWGAAPRSEQFALFPKHNLMPLC
jgi:hypothetical protein